MKISYRHWNMTDAETVYMLLRETWLDAYASFIPLKDILGYLDEHYEPEKIRKIVQDPQVVGFMAEVDGSVAGYEKTFHHMDENKLYVHQLYILPKYQGLGFGRHLMVLAAERAAALHLDKVWLGVMVKNESSVRWYQKLGYQIAETQPFTMGTTQVDHYIGYVPVELLLQSKESLPDKK